MRTNLSYGLSQKSIDIFGALKLISRRTPIWSLFYEDVLPTDDPSMFAGCLRDGNVAVY